MNAGCPGRVGAAGRRGARGTGGRARSRVVRGGQQRQRGRGPVDGVVGGRCSFGRVLGGVEDAGEIQFV